MIKYKKYYSLKQTLNILQIFEAFVKIEPTGAIQWN